MCGIAGIARLQPSGQAPDRDALGRMAASLHHRGPDALGRYRDPQVGLVHARLALVDLQTGQQPMAESTDRCWAVFNGEVYNHVELRQELQALGHRFRTHSDTEVLIAAWRAWGPAAFDRFNGQWAVALWNTDTRQLVLARDPCGICPLYWAEHQGHLLFASEVAALFAAAPDLPRALDPVGLAETLTFWSVVPPQSVFQGVQELPPGRVRVLTLVPGATPACAEHDAQPLRYGNRRGHPERFAGSVDDAAEAVEDALLKATRLRISRADVPVGSYLSGGLDSSLIAAMGRETAGGRFQTFSLRFEDAEFDETPYQRLMSERLGTRHHEVTVSRNDIARVFPEVIRHTERPVLRTAPAPLYLLSALVHGHGIKAVLTGEGADEMFAGYDLFREARVRRFWARQPDSAFRPLLLERLYPYLARSPVAQRTLSRQFFGRDLARHAEPGFGHGPRWHTTQALQRLLSPDWRHQAQQAQVTARLLNSLPTEFADWDPLSQDQYLEIRTLLQGYLLSSQGDRMLLGQSVEGRFPFLDPDVIALANRLPTPHKLCGLDEKHVLKKLAQRWVPADIIGRSKQPYRAPDAACFVGPDAPTYVAEVLSPDALKQSGVFDVGAVTQLLDKCQRVVRGNGPGSHLGNADNMALVAVLSTQLLHRDRVEARPDPHIPSVFGTDVDTCLPPEACRAPASAVPC